LSGKRLIALPSALLSFIMGLTWRLRLQEESPPAGLEFIKHPVVLSTEKAERELGFKFRYSSREALAAFLAARARAA
jgi:nucleoside-diphosphate-sugar epimerase